MIEQQNKLSQKSILIITISLMFVFFIIDTMIPLGVAGGVLYIMVILVSLWYEKQKFTIIVAISCTMLTITGFFSSPAGGELWKVIFNRSLAFFSIWTVTILSLQRKKINEEKEEAVKQREKAMSELKILQGFIPICASCKKIRDEEGQWSRMELYIAKNSEADFSHGLCPECVKTLYPDHKSKLKGFA